MIDFFLNLTPLKKKLLNICNLRALRINLYFQWIFGLFSSPRLVNYNFMKNEGCFVCFSVNPCMSASRWPRLLKLKRKKNYFKIIIGFFFTPPLLLATKVAISFVYCSPKTIKCTQKPKIEKRFTGIDQSSERASERVPFSTSYLQLALAHARNSRVKNW